MYTICKTCKAYDSGRQTSDNEICIECGDTESLLWLEDCDDEQKEQVLQHNTNKNKTRQVK